MSMFHSNSYISFHDTGPQGVILWASPSVYDCLGFDPDELVGLPGYDLLDSADSVVQARVVHMEHMINDLVATQVILRYRCKNGPSVPVLVVFSLCYDFIVNCVTLLSPHDSTIYSDNTLTLSGAYSSMMTGRVGSKKEEFARMKQHHAAFAANSWDPSFLQPEVRVCLILNRFTRNLVIMYASSATKMLFNIDPEDMVGIPLLIFIRSDDIASFVEQADTAKSTNVITHLRFWFQSPHLREEIPCEASLLGSADGMVMLVRRSRPFFRRRFLEDYYCAYNDQGEKCYYTKGRGTIPRSSSISSTKSESDQSRGSIQNRYRSRVSSKHSSSLRSPSPMSEASFIDDDDPEVDPIQGQGSPTSISSENTIDRHSQRFRKGSPGVRDMPLGSITELMEMTGCQDKLRPLQDITLRMTNTRFMSRENVTNDTPIIRIIEMEEEASEESTDDNDMEEADDLMQLAENT